jgi:hypothetical protein
VTILEVEVEEVAMVVVVILMVAVVVEVVVVVSVGEEEVTEAVLEAAEVVAATAEVQNHLAEKEIGPALTPVVATPTLVGELNVIDVEFHAQRVSVVVAADLSVGMAIATVVDHPEVEEALEVTEAEADSEEEEAVIGEVSVVEEAVIGVVVAVEAVVQ